MHHIKPLFLKWLKEHSYLIFEKSESVSQLEIRSDPISIKPIIKMPNHNNFDIGLRTESTNATLIDHIDNDDAIIRVPFAIHSSEYRNPLKPPIPYE